MIVEWEKLRVGGDVMKAKVRANIGAISRLAALPPATRDRVVEELVDVAACAYEDCYEMVSGEGCGRTRSRRGHPPVYALRVLALNVQEAMHRVGLPTTLTYRPELENESEAYDPWAVITKALAQHVWNALCTAGDVSVGNGRGGVSYVLPSGRWKVKRIGTSIGSARSACRDALSIVRLPFDHLDESLG